MSFPRTSREGDKRTLSADTEPPNEMVRVQICEGVFLVANRLTLLRLRCCLPSFQRSHSRKQWKRRA